MKKCPKVAYVLSFYHRWSNLSLFSLYGQPFSRYEPILKISIIFGHEIWNLKKGPKVAYVLSFYTRGSKLSLILLYGQPFSRYGPIFKIAIFGHETWNLKSAGSCIWTFFLHQGIEIKPIFAVHAAVFETEQFKVLISLINYHN